MSVDFMTGWSKHDGSYGKKGKQPQPTASRPVTHRMDPQAGARKNAITNLLHFL
jgi:hypothetical protein